MQTYIKWLIVFVLLGGALFVLTPPVEADVTINASQFTVGGAAAGGNNTVNTNWIGSAFTITGPISIGTGAGAGNNTVTLSNFVITANAASNIGNGTSNNVVTLLSNTTWNLGANALAIGTSGTGNVLTINGGTVASSAALVLFSGATTIGNSLIITNGGRFITTGASFRYALNSSSNSITVTGVGSVWSNTAQTFDGGSGGGDRITVSAGGLLVASGSEFDIGFFTPNETLTITDTGSTARITGNLILGQNAASNAVVIANGGKLVGTAISMGGAAGGDRNTLTVTGAGSVLSNMAGGSGTALSVGFTSGRSNSLVISQGGLVYNDGALTIGNSAAAFGNGVTVTGSGSMLTNTGNLIVGNFLTVPTYNFLTVSNGGRAFFANAYVGGSVANGAANSLLIVTGTGSVFQVASGGVLHLGGDHVAGTNNSVLVNDGGVLAANTLTIRAGSTGNTISNRNATYQFTIASPTITPNAGNIAITDGTISFRGINNADVTNNLGNGALRGITFAGANTFLLNAASNTTAGQTYTFDTGRPNGPSNYVNLAMINGATAYRGGDLTIGAAGSMLVSNTTATISNLVTNHGAMRIVGATANFQGAAVNHGQALIQESVVQWNNLFVSLTGSLVVSNATISGLITNTGSLSVVNANATFQNRVYNSGTNTMLNSVGTFNGGVINAGHWITDPTTNIFGSFGLTNTTSGVINMAAGDVYIFGNTGGTPSDFINVSTNKTAFDTTAGKFLFTGGLGLTQTFAVAGQNLGPAAGTATDLALNTGSTVAGFANNFALGTLELSNFSTVRVTDAFLDIGTNDFLMAGLYLENLFLGENSLLIIDTNVQVYFKNSNNWSLANIHLEGNPEYNNLISGLHQIVVIPEPSVLLLCVAGAVTLYFSRRRNRRARGSRA